MLTIEWAAGLFEGEGWIGNGGTVYTTKSGERHRYPVLRLAMSSTDEDVVRSFREVVGQGKVRGPYSSKRRPTAKLFWTWQADGSQARAVLLAILPFLHSRRRSRAMEFLS